MPGALGAAALLSVRNGRTGAGPEGVGQLSPEKARGSVASLGEAGLGWGCTLAFCSVTVGEENHTMLLSGSSHSGFLE